MLTSIHIRHYTTNDFEAVLALLQLNTPQYFASEEEEDLIHYLNKEIEDYFVVELHQKIIGAGGINYSEDRKTGIISWDIIHPEHQGKKIGYQLLNYRIQLLKENKSIEQIIVRTSQLTYQFYEKSEFLLSNIEKDYWAEGFDLYYMVFF